MDQKIIYKKFNESGPLVVTAIHDGHNLRKEVEDIISLHENVRLMEEDPFTGEWTSIGNTQIIALQSRFEVDLNRPREKAVYQKPEDAWGLSVWKNQPSKEIVDRSLEEYDSFYKDVYQIFSDLEKKFSHFVVFDLHSYNYRREGPNGKPANPDENPEINIGTATIDLLKWGPLVEHFITDLRNFKFNNRHLDVRENIKFKGGQFSRWIHQTFPESACSISVEFKKFFMDEWTGKPNQQQLEEIRLTLQSTIPGVLEELKKTINALKTEKPNTISNSLIDEICERLSDNKQVRRTLPEWGRLNIDRQLPFLCVYRLKSRNKNSISDGLITGEASYLTATESRKQNKQLSLLVKSIAKTLKDSFGSFLIVEVWISKNEVPTYNSEFKIIRTKKSEILSTIETLERSLKRIKIRKDNAKVDIVSASKISPPGLSDLISPVEAAQLGIHQIGIEVSSIYINNELDQVFPLIYRKLKRGFSRALKNSFFEFTRKNTSFQPQNFQSLGRQSMVKAVWEVDNQLAEISSGFDFLLQVTPTNSSEAWSTFKRNHFITSPQFIYRPLPIDPSIAKRQLYKIPIERIEDPTLAQLFRERQLEIDRKFTMLIDIGTPRFLYGSLQLFGSVDDTLLKTAKELLEQISPRSRDNSLANSIDANTFAERAKLELDYFRKTLPNISTKIIVRDDITGLMVSKGNLLIGAKTKIPAARVEALIAHEVGTHVLTYLNGKTQALQQLYIGLPGYDELQEGLAVLSEYLVGGLTGSRLRLLAARVVAAHSLINGASFSEVFHQLNKEYGFERHNAFSICTRTFRGGGLTKDAVYLRGLVQLMEYLKNGGELEPLFIGKISSDHIPIIKELQWRKVLHPAPLRPAFFENANILTKLQRLRNGLTILNLIQRR